MKKPRSFYLDKEIITRPNLCTHFSRTDEFEPSERMLIASEAAEFYTTIVILAFGAGVVWALIIISLFGGLNDHC